MSASTQSHDQGCFDAKEHERQLRQRANALLESASRAGGEQSEAFCVYRESINIAYEHGDLKLAEVAEGASSGLRVLKAGRMGFAASNQSGAQDIARLASDALELARIAPQDEHNCLAEQGREPRPAPPLDPELASLPIEAVTEAARLLLERAQAVDPRLSVDSASLGLTRSAAAVVSSRGIEVSESEAALELSLFGMAVDGEEVGGFDYWSARSCEYAQLDAIIESSVEQFTRAALGNLGAGVAQSYRGAVLFSPAAFADIFIAPLVSAASAIAVQRGRSALAGKIGQRIADEGLSITDDPSDRMLSGACTFDREGVAAEPFAILTEGVLQGWLYNAYAAHVDGVASTGHALGGTRGAPGLGPHAIRVAGGRGGDADALRGQLGRGLVVGRFSGTVDPASGDFSGVAKSARWVEAGEQVRSVRETLISGNAFELLAGKLALSDRAEVVMASLRAPWALIDGVSVTSG